MVGILTGLVFTYALAPLILFLAVAQFTRATEEEAPRVFFLTAGLGTAFISLILTRCYQLLPERTDGLYVGVVLGVYAFLALVGCRKLPLVAELFRRARAFLSGLWSRPRWPELVLLALAAFIVAVLVAQAVLAPLSGNDPLGYAALARLIHRYKSVAFYPCFTPEPRTGFYCPGLHPLGYTSLIAWSYIIQGTSAHAGIMKLIAPAFAIHSLLLLWHLLAGKGRIAGPVGVLLLIATPFYFVVTAICHTDPLRVYTFFVAFVWLVEALRRPRLPWLIGAGAATGMSLHSHSIGLLALPFLFFIYFIKSKDPWGRRILQVAVLGAGTLVVGGPRYVQNTLEYGRPVGSQVEVWNMPELGMQDYLLEDRELGTLRGRIVNGLLKGFEKRDQFGLCYWLLALAVACHYRRLRDDLLSSVFLWVILSFYAMAALSLIAGVDLIIQNDRYFLTVQPFVVYHAALFLGHQYETRVLDA